MVNEASCRRRTALKALGTGALAGLAGCMGGDDGSITWRYTHEHTNEHNVGQAAEDFAERVEEETDGRLSIDVFPSSELGDIEEQVEGVSSGSIDMGHYDYSAMASMYRPLFVFNTPFIYEDTDHLLEVLDPRSSPVIQDMEEEMIEQTGMRLIGRYYYGRRMLTCNERIEHPDDLDGKTIRVVPNDMWIAMGSGMGAQPESVEFSELPSALATGVVEGQENPLDTIIDNGLHEHQSHVMLTAHMRAPISVTVNEDSWQELSEEDQGTVYNLIDEIGQETVDRGLEKEEELLAELQEDESTTVVGSGELGTEEELDRADFREPVRAEVESEFEDLVPLMDQMKDMA